MKEKDKYFYSWEEFDIDAYNLYQEVKKFHFNSIVGLAFGGLPLLVVLKNQFDLPIHILVTSHYNNTEKKSLQIENFDFRKIKSPTLIVDDIADSGDTLIEVTKILKSKQITFKIATLLYKEHSKFRPDFFSRKVENAVWIVFPWERLKDF